MKIPLRKLVVNQIDFLWRLYGESKSIDDVELFFMAYLSGYENTPVKICFKSIHNAAPTLNSAFTENINSINLHRPKFAKELIEYVLEHGWLPREGSQPYIFRNGRKILKELGYDLNGI